MSPHGERRTRLCVHLCGLENQLLEDIYRDVFINEKCFELTFGIRRKRSMQTVGGGKLTLYVRDQEKLD